MQSHPNTNLTNVAGLVDRHRWVIEAFVFTLIIGLGVAARIWLVDQPNFKPVAALILFAGFFFQRGSLALVAMLLIMLVSNQQLGNYEWPLALSVYAGLAVSALLGMQIKRRVGHQAGEQLQPKSIAMFAGASIVMSTCFYLLTNGMVWCVGAWYPQTWEGFVQCYAAGIPFYRMTLIGDLLFTGATLVAYSSVVVLVQRLQLSMQSNRTVEASL